MFQNRAGRTPNGVDQAETAHWSDNDIIVKTRNISEQSRSILFAQICVCLNISVYMLWSNAIRSVAYIFQEKSIYNFLDL